MCGPITNLNAALYRNSILGIMGYFAASAPKVRETVEEPKDPTVGDVRSGLPFDFAEFERLWRARRTTPRSGRASLANAYTSDKVRECLRWDGHRALGFRRDIACTR